MPGARQFCVRGHDTAVCGRYKNGNCKGCAREREQTRLSRRTGEPRPAFSESGPEGTTWFDSNRWQDWFYKDFEEQADREWVLAHASNGGIQGHAIWSGWPSDERVVELKKLARNAQACTLPPTTRSYTPRADAKRRLAAKRRRVGLLLSYAVMRGD